MTNEQRDRELYRYPGSSVLRTLEDLRDPDALAQYERQTVSQRLSEGVPAGRFDLAHLQSIHRHLFQDVYAWAGEVRQTVIGKGGSGFIRMVASALHSRTFTSGYRKRDI